MTSNHVSSDSEPSPPNPTCLSNFLASGCPPTLPVSDVPVLEKSDRLRMSENLFVCLLYVLRFGEIDLWLRSPKTVCYSSMRMK